MIFVGYRNDRFFCPYKSLSFECYIYATVPIFLFLAWATCGIMAAASTDKIHTTLIGDRTTKLNTLVFINCLQKCCITFEVLIKQTICLQKLSQIFFKNSSLLVQDWSSCCHLLLWARNYKISNLKCYIVLLFVHFKRRNNINRKMFCVLLFT